MSKAQQALVVAGIRYAGSLTALELVMQLKQALGARTQHALNQLRACLQLSPRAHTLGDELVGDRLADAPDGREFLERSQLAHLVAVKLLKAVELTCLVDLH